MRTETIGANTLNLIALRADLQKMALPLRVVVADDDDVLRDLLVLNLEAEGLVVYEAADGARALQLIAEERPDLVVLDVMMPKFDGLAALRALKGEPLTTNIPIVLLTARAGEDEIQEGWAAGADYYLTKPFRVEDLLDLVNELRPAAQLHAEQR
jgi:CheY-like chemotaxis protein